MRPQQSRRANGTSAPNFDLNLSRPFPNQMKAVLKYQDTQKVTLATSAGYYTTYSMNSAYDPFYNPGGGTATGFLQYANMYSRYYVEAIDVQVHFVNTSGVSTGAELRAFIFPVPYEQIGSFPTVVALTPDILEGQNCSTVTLSFLATGFRDAVATIKRRYLPWRIEGYPSQPSSYFDMSSTVTADPLRQPIVNIGAVAADYASGSTRAYEINVVLAYTVRFFCPSVQVST